MFKKMVPSLLPIFSDVWFAVEFKISLESKGFLVNTAVEDIYSLSECQYYLERLRKRHRLFLIKRSV